MTAADATTIHDPYTRCEASCSHDLARGITVAELLDADGPFPDAHPLLTFRPIRRTPPTAPVAIPAAS